MSVTIFFSFGESVSLVVGKSPLHGFHLYALMVGDEGPFLFGDVPINPDLSSRDKPEGIAIASLRKVGFPRVAYMGAVNKNNPKSMGAVLSQVFLPGIIARRPWRVFVG